MKFLSLTASGIQGIGNPGKINSTSTNLAFPLVHFSSLVRVFSFSPRGLYAFARSLLGVSAASDRPVPPNTIAAVDGEIPFTSPPSPRSRLLSSGQLIHTTRPRVLREAARGLGALLWCYSHTSNIAALQRGLHIATRLWLRVD
jgi:hypothetical protein